MGGTPENFLKDREKAALELNPVRNPISCILKFVSFNNRSAVFKRNLVKYAAGLNPSCSLNKVSRRLEDILTSLAIAAMVIGLSILVSICLIAFATLGSRSANLPKETEGCGSVELLPAE
tara:strand:- start:105 stop:464 length:360 start_codon:yes stop_codon:yes gene_type:complete